MLFRGSILVILVTVATAAWAAKDPKPAPKPAVGVKTPGVMIPFEQLKSEATIELASPPTGFHFTGDTLVLAEAAGVVRRFDAKTNKPFDPSRDVKDVQKACGGLVNGLGGLWTVACGDSTKLAKIDQPEAARGPRRGPRAEGAKPEAAKSDAAKPEAAKGDAAKPEAPKASLPKPEPFMAKPSTLTPLEQAPAARTALAASDDSLWLLADKRTALQRIDPSSGMIVAEVRLPGNCTSLLSAESALWVVCPGEARLLRLDPRTNLVDKRIDVAAEPIALAAGEGSIWVWCRKEGKISRVDPKTNKVTATIETALPGAEASLAYGEGYLWASAPGFPVMRIAPAVDKVVQQFYGPGGGVIAVGSGSVWVTAADGKTVTRFDPKRIQATLAE